MLGGEVERGETVHQVKGQCPRQDDLAVTRINANAIL
jgi:hypothetical protein